VTKQITNSLTTNASPATESVISTAAAHTVSSEAEEPASVPAVPVKRLNPIKLKQLEDQLHHAEEEIPRLEQAIASAEARLGNFISAEQSQKDAADLEKLRSKRTTLLAEWEELSLTLEEQQLA
jgi:ATP-binding cassette, subfamily F, member 3